MKLKVIFEDHDLFVVHKPPGLKVHGARDQDTLESRAIAQVDQPLVMLHRLDMGTTGMVMFAKNRPSAAKLTEDFAAKRIRKAYLALVTGLWRPNWNRKESWIEAGADNRMISRPIEDMASEESRRALTTFRLIASAENLSWIEAIPKTGRKHQIRLHCADFGCPIFGDPFYGKTGAFSDPIAQPGFLALHAYRLDFRHPQTGEAMRLVDPIPETWTAQLEKFGGPAGPESILARIFR